MNEATTTTPKPAANPTANPTAKPKRKRLRYKEMLGGVGVGAICAETKPPAILSNEDMRLRGLGGGGFDKVQKI